MLNRKKRYVIHYLAFVVVFSALVVLFNLIINPYAIFQNHYIPISAKPAALVQMRLYKAYEVERFQPKTIILGTSRAGVGFDPNHAYFKHKPAYNLALDGANIYEILKYLEHANQHNHLQEVLLSLDIMSFNVHMPNKPDFDEKRLTKQASLLFDKQLISSLYSISATQDSLKTLLKRFDKTLPTMTELGQTTEDALITYKNVHRGHYNTSKYSESTYTNEVYHPLAIENENNSTFARFAELLRYCHDNHIKLTMIIPPHHARHYLLLDSLGYWETYEEWKRKLVYYNEQIASFYHVSAFSLWDFTAFNQFTTEYVPEKDNNDYDMSWFWESSHFKKELGNVILNEVGTAQASTFGVLLTSTNIEQSLKEIRMQKNEFTAVNPAVAYEFSSLKKSVST